VAVCSLRALVRRFHPEATVQPTLVAELEQIVTDAGGAVFFVELACSRATLLARIPSESRHKFGKLTDAAFYETLETSGAFEYAGMPARGPDATVDTEAVEPETAAADIVAALEAKWPGGGIPGVLDVAETPPPPSEQAS